MSQAQHSDSVELRHSSRVSRMNPDVEFGVKAERVLTLCQRRGGQASHVTIKYGEFVNSVNQHRSLDEVLNKFDALKTEFEKFRTAHQEYVNLAAEVEPSKIDYYEDHYRSMEVKLRDAMSKCDILKEAEGLQDSVKIEDSVSQIGPRSHVTSRATSKSSGVSSALAKAAAKKASLLARAQYMQHKQELTRKQFQEAQLQIQDIDMKAEIHAATVEEETLAKYVGGIDSVSVPMPEISDDTEEKAAYVGKSEFEHIKSDNVKLSYVATPKSGNAVDKHVNSVNVCNDENAKLDRAKSVKLDVESFLYVKPSVNQSSSHIPERPSYEILNKHRPANNIAQSSMLNPLAPEWITPPVSRHQPVIPDTIGYSPIYSHDQISDMHTRITQEYPTIVNRPPEVPQQAMGSQLLANKEFSKTGEENHDSVPNFVESQIMIQSQLLDAVRLPKTKLMSYDGDPMQFWIFMNTFNSCVHNSNVSDGDKLNRLFEYCTGKAAKVIRPCALMTPTEGYAKARFLLQQRFRNNYTIAKAWIQKITEGPNIKPNNGEALQDFTDDVRGCMEVLRAMKMLQEVDSQDRMVKILSRLPIYLQTRGRKAAYETRRRTNEYPNFQEFVYFLERVSEEINDPVFGKLDTGLRNSKDNIRSHQARKKGSSFNIQASNNIENQVTKKETNDRKTKELKCHVVIIITG